MDKQRQTNSHWTSFSTFSQWRQSASLTRQWSLAVFFTVLPLLLAVGYAIYSLDKQNQGQHALVSSVIRVNQLGLQIVEDIKEMERLARQSMILQDERLDRFSEDKASKLNVKLLSLAEVMILPERQHRIDRLMTLLATKTEVLMAMSSIDTADRFESLGWKYDTANKLGADIKKDTEQYINDALALSEQEFQAKRKYLLLIGSLVLPVTLLLLGFFSYRISQPLKSLAGAIRRLGQGAIYEPVMVEGPGDIAVLVSRLEWMRERLLVLEKQKNMFLRHVTHELKTPLAAIMEATSLLMDEVPGAINSKQKNVLNILERNARSLLEQIQQLLNYNEVRVAIESSHQLVSFQELVQRAVRRQADTAKARGVKIVLNGAEMSLPLDSVRIDMMLSNLLSNAVNYSPSDDEVVLAWGQVNKNEIWFEVIDHGPGIPESEHEAIFQPFYQGSAKRIGSTKGSGLGLSITRECIDALHGSIHIESRPGKGSKFRVTLPIKGQK
jgi:two-component system sensor histidine kinase GlrK